MTLLVGGSPALIAFLRWRTRTSGPLPPTYIVRDRSRVGWYLSMVLRAMHHHAPMALGTALLLLFVAVLLSATQVSARLLHRATPRVLTVTGLVTTALGLMLLAGGAPDAGPATSLPAMFVIGFGLGIAFMPVFSLATDAVATRHSGGASAALVTTQHLGGAISSALFSAVARPAASGAWPSVSCSRPCSPGRWSEPMCRAARTRAVA
ncbi:MFS transporter [Streptomyces sp. IMTB 2501]|uniref:MFS transporter n=1 Tax=Streptomyces sp. IMTB 2501 TaxID=1776340 RepID=UPI00117FBFA6|nr:MFS transporter [Streptomyces sp. IMTB 2501]